MHKTWVRRSTEHAPTNLTNGAPGGKTVQQRLVIAVARDGEHHAPQEGTLGLADRDVPVGNRFSVI